MLTVPRWRATPSPIAARAGLDLATEAAGIWAADADLVYVENDETVGGDGTAARWGYLFFSDSRGRARGYTIRDGKILEAADLDFELDAPPLATDWVDSDVALAAAEDKAGREYRPEHGGRLETMLLIRGAFHDGDPDASTWALVYTADKAAGFDHRGGRRQRQGRPQVEGVVMLR